MSFFTEYFVKEGKNKITVDEFAKGLNVKAKDLSSLKKCLDGLEADGHIIKIKNAGYAIPQWFGMFRGRMHVTSKGVGFLVSDDSAVSDIFLPKSELKGAMNGDIVLVRVLENPTAAKKAKGTVLKIVKRKYSQIVGTFTKNERFGFVIPDDRKMGQDVFVSRSNSINAENNDKVVVEIIKWATDKKNIEGKIVEVLGQKDAYGVDVLSIIRKFDIREDFSKQVLNEASGISTSISKKEIKGRVDLRDEIVITIDGPDAKDLDDAISIAKLENGNFKLGVHIADVSHYVQEGSYLDVEAMERGTSTYLLNNVVPMLPEVLSNGICSLNPQVDRLTLSCIMEVDSAGKVVNYEICNSVINSNARMIYSDVSDILEEINNDTKEKYLHLYDTFKLMQELASLLRKKREKRGAIDFDFSEYKVELDEMGKPIDIVYEERRTANRIIEEFMLLANETVAEHMFWLKMPCVYRVHETPTEDKIEKFNNFLRNMGHRVKGALNKVHPKALQDVLVRVEPTTLDIVSKLMLRSLKQAHYSSQNGKHFGLAADYYTHFTSPIRRYPDLIVHRIVKETLAGSMDHRRIGDLQSIVEKVAEKASELERNSEKAERDLKDLKMTEYMADKVGETFLGVISSVLPFGIFVELKNSVEGLIKVENLGSDYFVFDEEHLRFVGERSKKVYKLGDKIKVLVSGVNVGFREIDFMLSKGRY
ncbi:ribonuclease R [bacterium]